MNDPVVLVERATEGYAVLTLNRPAAMNALSRQLRGRTGPHHHTELEADPSIRVLILTGAGPCLHGRAGPEGVGRKRSG